jgi:NAD(P)-dependent dehydrogenase (short-subunit alcohol dehydrogenase family)
MAASINSSPVPREQDLLGQTIAVIGGSSGIGLETARLARAKGGEIILTARNPDRLHRAGLELGASIAAFDATDFSRLGRFFDALPAPIDHLLVTGPGACYAPLAGFDLDAARRDLDARLLLPLQVARDAASKVRPAGTLLFIGSTGGRRTAAGPALSAALKAALPAMTRSLALEVAPVRVNLIAAGLADTPRRAGRIADPADIAALAVQLMTNTAVTGATFDIDRGQQLAEG